MMSFRKAALGFVVAAVMVLAVEAVARIALYRPANIIPPGRQILYATREPIHNAGPLGDLVPGSSLYALLPDLPYVVRVNPQGLRNANAVRADAVRILAIGDSFTFGPYVSNSDTWPAWLQAYLTQRNPGIAIDVLNAGVAGYTIRQEVSYLKEKGLRARPSLVLLAAYFNDIVDLRTRQVERFPRPVPRAWSVVSWMTRRSAVAHTARDWATRGLVERERTALAQDPRPSAADRNEMAERYRAHFLELARMLEAEGIPLGVLALPEFTQVGDSPCPDTFQQFMKALTSEARVPFLDLLPRFREHEIDELYLLQYDPALPRAEEGCFPERRRYVGDAHLSRFGYQVIARSVMDWMPAVTSLPRVAAPTE